MGAMYPDYKCWVRGKSVATGETVYGNYVQMLIDSVERPHIYPFPKHANSGNHAYTPDPIEVSADSVCRDTGLTDFHGDSIYEGDTVKLPTGQKGEVYFGLGTWGVELHEMLDWDEMENIAKRASGNYPNFLYNDNFISFYELVDNFCPENACDSSCSAVCIVSGGEKTTETAEFEETWGI